MHEPTKPKNGKFQSPDQTKEHDIMTSFIICSYRQARR
jgi:hypothetical protein